MSEEHLAFIEAEAGYEQVIFVADFMCDVINAAPEDVVSYNSLKFDERVMDEGIGGKRLKKILSIFVDLGLLADTGLLRGLSATPYLEQWPALDVSAKEEVLRRATKGEALDDVFADVAGEAAATPLTEDGERDEVGDADDSELITDEGDDLWANDDEKDANADVEDDGEGEIEEDDAEPEDVVGDDEDEVDDFEAEDLWADDADVRASFGEDDDVGAEAGAGDDDVFGDDDEGVGVGDHGEDDVADDAGNGEQYDPSPFDEFEKDASTDTGDDGEGDAGEGDEGRGWRVGRFSASTEDAGEAGAGSSDWSGATIDDPNEVENFMASLGDGGGDADNPTDPKRPAPVSWANHQNPDSSGFEKTQGWNEDQNEDGGRSLGWRASSSSSAGEQSRRGWGNNEDTDAGDDTDAGGAWGQQPPPPGETPGWGSGKSGKRWDGGQPSASGGASGWDGDGSKRKFDPNRAAASGWSGKKDTSFKPGSRSGKGGDSGGGGWNQGDSGEEDATAENDPMSDFLSGSVSNLPGTETNTGGLGDWLDDDYGDDVPDAWRDDLDEVADYIDEHQQGATLTIQELEQVVVFLQRRLADLRERGVSDEKGLSVKFEIQINEIIDEMRRRAQDD